MVAADISELTAPVDTVAVSLNKGLCAPYGAVLAGDAETIAAAREHLHRLGAGTVHKAGLLAAAGLVAWEQMRGRLLDDHRRARRLADLLGLPAPETNIVLTELPRARTDTEFFDQRPQNALRADDLARAVVYALGEPAHVDVNEILIRPASQTG